MLLQTYRSLIDKAPKPLSRLIERVGRHIYNRFFQYRHTRSVFVAIKPAGKTLWLQIDPYDFTDVGFVVNKTYEPEIISFMAHWLSEGSIFVDAGANIGYHTLIAASLVGEGGSVIAFEPNPANAVRLRSSVERNRFKNIVLHEMALGATPGLATLTVRNSNSGSGTLVGDFGQDAVNPHELRSFNCSVAVLSAFVSNRVRLLKIDVQGAELDILRGGEPVLTLIDAIVVELNSSAVAPWLKERGFRMELRSKRNGVFIR